VSSGNHHWGVVRIDGLGVKCPPGDLVVLVGKSLTDLLNILWSDVYPAKAYLRYSSSLCSMTVMKSTWSLMTDSPE
jgi:hypothetical protein